MQDQRQLACTVLIKLMLAPSGLASSWARAARTHTSECEASDSLSAAGTQQAPVRGCGALEAAGTRNSGFGYSEYNTDASAMLNANQCQHTTLLTPASHHHVASARSPMTPILQ